ncbi:MAG: Lrp/AsnC family transcriptional regulator [Candidatus Nanopelagicales bacterium]
MTRGPHEHDPAAHPAAPAHGAAHGDAGPPTGAIPLVGTRRLDAVDRALLEELQRNGRATYADLSRLVGLSAPSVQDRVKRLEDRGVITGYHARAAADVLGYGVTALVSVELSEGADPDAVDPYLHDLPEVEDCWFLTGEASYVLKVRVPDVPGLSATLVELRGIPGVARTRTNLVLRTVVEGRPRLAPEW